MVNSSSTHTNTTIKKAYPKNLINSPFIVFHQNIRGLRNKNNELLGPLLPNLPQVLCLTERHLKEQEIEHLATEHYTLGAKFCRHNLKQGGTCIIVCESLTFTSTDLQEFCTEQDIEITAAKITALSTVILVICIYRSTLVILHIL